MTKNNTPLESTLQSFISKVGRSKVSIVVPLFGYWKDLPSYGKEMEDALKIVVNRLYSSVHQVYVIFVAEDRRMSQTLGNFIVGKQKGGNTKGVHMGKGSSYGEYVRAGISKALEDTECQYVVCVNPWTLVQHNAVDALIDRINRDDAKIVSGFDVKGLIEDANFERHQFQLPLEERGIDTNFFGMKRMAAELIDFDAKYATHYYLGRDAWQTLFSRGFESIVSQRIPIFPFNVDWTDLESRGDFELDRQHFADKWKFTDQDIQYK